MAAYIVWRALRTLNPGWSYLLSVPIWLCEFAGFTLSNAFVLSLWNQIHRPARKLGDMLPLEDMPAVDVYVPTYSGESNSQTIQRSNLPAKQEKQVISVVTHPSLTCRNRRRCSY
jgi:hypothetical protein